MKTDAARLCAEAIELTLVPGVGTKTQSRLWKTSPMLSETFAMDNHALEAFGVSADSVHALKSRIYRSMAEEIVDWCVREECHLVVRGTEAYPAALQEIYDPPLVLYTRGDMELLSAPSLAIVGTRRPTFYGLQMAEGLASDLGSRGLAVVSGLARGIDAAAHRGCLESGGRTLAVLGCGIDVVYPREHRQLTEKILQKGLLVTEFPPGTSPSPQNFPVRNRIISGIALGTLIVEASEYSGSLITARLAMEQNREVFALPGNLTSPQSFGPNFLIKQGAKLVQSWRDIIEELPSELRHRILAQEDCSQSVQPSLEMLTNEELSVLHLLETDEAVHFDRVLERSSLEITRLSELLLRLEMIGQIRQVPGNLYVKLARPPK